MSGIFIVDLQGTEILEDEIAILKHPNVGALLLFSRNFSNPPQLKDLVEIVHSLRPDIFIALDQEGGIVQRFQRHGFRSLPAARVYGEVYDLNAEAGIKLARRFGEMMAKDLLAYGIDLSIAPVLDIHGASEVIAKLDRAFHHDPEVIIELARAFIQGMNSAGMPAVGKHFPGHGSVCADSHITMPVSDDLEEKLRNADLRPFIELISENLLGAVMPAHVTYPAIDPNNPAGFSQIWLQNILREELHFQGLIISDCLGMVGADIGNMDRRVNQALTAGCDMLIVCNQSRTLLNSLLQTLTCEQTKESRQRIAAFKSQMMRFSPDKIAQVLPSVTLPGTEPKGTLSLSENQRLNNTTAI
jgi:beta-N-acetylhexosaminidase